MSRYELPEPKCNHKPTGYVLAGSFDGAHQSHTVCARPACVADAMEWAQATHLTPVVHHLYKRKEDSGPQNSA